MFEVLPHEYVSPKELPDVVKNGGNCHSLLCNTMPEFFLIHHFFYTDTRKTYATVINRRDHLVRKDGGEYELEDYKKHPEQYTSIFADQVNLLLC